MYALILDAFVTETRGTPRPGLAIRSGDFQRLPSWLYMQRWLRAVGRPARKLCSELQKALNEKRLTPEHALAKELFDEMTGCRPSPAVPGMSADRSTPALS